MFTKLPLLRWLALFALVIGLPSMAAEPPPLEAYGELPAFERAAIAPSGNFIAVVGFYKGERRLLIFDANRKLLRVSTIGDLKIRDLEFVGDDDVLVINSQTEKLGVDFVADKYEASYVTIVPVDPQAEIEMVFRSAKTIVDSVFGRFGSRYVDGKWFGYFGGVAVERGGFGGYYLTHTRPTLYAVDIARNKPHKADAPAREGNWRDWLIGADGEIAAVFDMQRNTGSWKISDAKGKAIVSGTDPEGDAGLVTLGKDGKSIIYASGEAEGKGTRWYEIPLDGSAKPIEVLPGIDVDRLYIDRVNGHWLGYLPRGDNPKTVFFDPAWQARADKVRRAFAGRHFEIVDWDEVFDHVIVHTSGSQDSGTWYMVDIGNLKADALGYDRPEIAPEAVGAVSSFAYKAGDGLDLDGVLTLPPGRKAKNLPLVIFPHGGPTAHDEVQFDWWAQAFASRGYAVFQPNFRGSTNRDSAFMHAGDGQWGRKMQSDISDGLAALAEAGIVDPARACIMGASYGGYAALAGVTLQQGLYRCAVAVAPVADVEMMFDTDVRESGRSRVLRRSLIEELGDKASYDAISPRRHAANADAPILLIHGKDDTVVPFKQSAIMADALKDADKPYEFVVLDGEDHWLSRPETRLKMLESAVAFVEKYDPPD